MRTSLSSCQITITRPSMAPKPSQAGYSGSAGLEIRDGKLLVEPYALAMLFQRFENDDSRNKGTLTEGILAR